MEIPPSILPPAAALALAVAVRMISYNPKHFTAEPAKIAKTHQGSTAWAKMFRPAPRLLSRCCFGYRGFLCGLGDLGGENSVTASPPALPEPRGTGPVRHEPQPQPPGEGYQSAG